MQPQLPEWAVVREIAWSIAIAAVVAIFVAPHHEIVNEERWLWYIFHWN